MRREPTEAERRVLDAVRQLAANGEVPTLGKIGKIVQRTKNPVQEAVKRLVRLKRLRRGKYRAGKPRTLIVID